jgi:DNA-directed RNA polymerase subunit RPC12/RpoP
MRGHTDRNPDFRCVRCGNFVPAQTALAGVNHRNHCPYCLWSRHLDLFEAGDRLSACKAPMEPVGLTFKRRNKKYRAGGGELMLVHHCTGCGALSINRIAADDLGEVVLDAFERSMMLPGQVQETIQGCGIDLLGRSNRKSVCRQLYGERNR